MRLLVTDHHRDYDEEEGETPTDGQILDQGVHARA